MQTFFDACIHHILNQYKDKNQKLTILFPNKRSAISFKRQLATHNYHTPCDFFAIDDFIPQMVGIPYSEQMTLLLELFEVYSQLDTQIRLDKFAGWGYVLLRDFDMIDKCLVNAKQILQNIRDIHEVKIWNPSQSNTDHSKGSGFQLWEHLYPCYHQLKSKLEQRNMAYPGMLYRQLAENTEKYLIEKQPYQQYLFIGFNYFTPSEDKIFKTLHALKKAEALWDSDAFFTEEDSENPAGIYLKKHKKEFGNQWNFEEDILLTEAKEIEILSVNNASQQGRVANQLLKNWQVDAQSKDTSTKTAIVLSDESLLLPVLHSIEPMYEGLNITMGFSLRNTSLFNFIDTLFELQQSIRPVKDRLTDSWIKKFSFRYVVKLLSHPYMSQYEFLHFLQDEPVSLQELSWSRTMIQYIHKYNLFAISAEEIFGSVLQAQFKEGKSEAEQIHFVSQLEKIRPFLELLFTIWDKKLLPTLSFFEALCKALPIPEDSLESEHLKRLEALVLDFKNSYQRYKTESPNLAKQITLGNFKSFLYQAFRNEQVVFDTDKNSPLQVMGLLETRCLDFENVILLSVNETILPRQKKINSMIPFDVAQAFEMPTYQTQEAITAYHLYRLMKRTKKLALVYVQPSDTFGGKEKSRFLLQIQNDLAIRNPNITISSKEVVFKKNEDTLPVELIIHKNPKIIEKIKQKLSDGLSPAVLNIYVYCSLRYYFSQIAELKESFTADEDLGADKFGTIIHEILEDMFRRLSGEDGIIQEEDLRNELKQVEELVTQKLKQEAYTNYDLTGANYITKEVAIVFIQNFIEAQIKEMKMAKAPFEVIILENVEAEGTSTKRKPQLAAIFNITTNGEVIPIKISGIIDRIDRINNKVRIIDYKTGTVDKSSTELHEDKIHELIQEKKHEKLRQLWMYKYILAKQLQGKEEIQLGNHVISKDNELSAGIYGLRKIKDGLLELKFGKDKKEIFTDLNEYIHFTEKELTNVILEMLDSKLPFEKTPDWERCEYCTYKDICNR